MFSDSLFNCYVLEWHSFYRNGAVAVERVLRKLRWWQTSGVFSKYYPLFRYWNIWIRLDWNFTLIAGFFHLKYSIFGFESRSPLRLFWDSLFFHGRLAKFKGSQSHRGHHRHFEVHKITLKFVIFSYFAFRQYVNM